MKYEFVEELRWLEEVAFESLSLISEREKDGWLASSRLAKLSGVKMLYPVNPPAAPHSSSLKQSLSLDPAYSRQTRSEQILYKIGGNLNILQPSCVRSVPSAVGINAS